MPTDPSSARSGLLAAGNFIIDHVKILDYYPKEEMLATILDQKASNGGGPYNVLKNLSKLGATYPLAAAGLVVSIPWVLQSSMTHWAPASFPTRPAAAMGKDAPSLARFFKTLYGPPPLLAF